MAPKPLTSNHSLRRILPQILIPMLVLLLVSNITVLATTYVVLDKELHEQNAKLLITEATTLSNNFHDIIDNLEIATRQAAGFPAIEGVVETAGNPQLQKEWKSRVAQLFVGMIRANPALSQVRLIDFKGSEVVRAESLGGSSTISVVSEDKLQNKSHRSYFQSAIGLSRDQSFVSNINLNKENGEVVEPRELVIRAAKPIFAKHSYTPYGIIVINLSMASPLKRLSALAGELHTTSLVDQYGNYLYHSGDNIAITNPEAPPRNFFDDYPMVDSTSIANHVYKTERNHLTVVPLTYGNKSDDITPLFLTISSKIADTVSVRTAVIRQTTLVITAVLLIAIVICVFITRRITTPLTRMSRSLGRSQEKSMVSLVPPFAPLEIQQFARSFDFAYAKLASNQTQLEREIADKQLAQAGLEEKVKLLNNANNELQQFTYIASHDLQEPLRTIRSFIAVINKQYADLYDDKGRTMLSFIDEASIRMEALVKDLLDYGRIGVKNSPRPVDLSEVVASVKKDLTKAIETSGATVRECALPQITGYHTELRLLFQNLFSNAIKFSRNGIAPEITLSKKRVPGGWQISVCDNGIGIADEHRHKIFGVFKRLHTKNEYPGTGIGLAHCKKVVELHGGDIWIEANATHGSCITFTLREAKNEKA